VPTLPAAGRHDLADDEWCVLKSLLPEGKRPGRPPKWGRRQLIDGIRWRIRAGSPWRDVPPEYGPWQSVYGLFRRWQRDGTWRRLLIALQALADAAGHVTWDVSVDSGTARAHQHAAGARKNGSAQKEPPGGSGAPEPDDHALGRSRGGLACKFHLACSDYGGSIGEGSTGCRWAAAGRCFPKWPWCPAVGMGRGEKRARRGRPVKSLAEWCCVAYKWRRAMGLTGSACAGTLRRYRRLAQFGLGGRAGSGRGCGEGWGCAGAGVCFLRS
jgi:transposase